MSRMRALAVLSRVLALCALAFPVLAADPSGWWNSSSGSQIQIWASPQAISVIVHPKKGPPRQYAGRWVRGSSVFVYEVPGKGFYQATFDRHDHDLIHVQGPNLDNVWRRADAQAATRGGDRSASRDPRSQGDNASRRRTSDPAPYTPLGNWRSSSGAAVQVSGRGEQVFVTLVTRRGERHQGIGRWLPGHPRFDYSISGFPGQATCTFEDVDRIRVVYGDSVTYWYRM
ncbi:MAG: hypothetical protein H6983_12925 [Ectothiorhodospiraceae bacterium]|nr:hypothetical protein [Ectothiorhodospiraceae bacterium]